jgi:hypothetical protein
MGGFRCVDNIYWEEYQDRLTFEKFYWAEEDWNHYRWDKPKIPENVVKREILPEGQEMLYPFPGDIKPQLGVITKVRFDDQTGEELYDIEKKGKGGVKVRWVKRDLLTLPPRYCTVICSLSLLCSICAYTAVCGWSRRCCVD